MPRSDLRTLTYQTPSHLAMEHVEWRFDDQKPSAISGVVVAGGPSGPLKVTYEADTQQDGRVRRLYLGTWSKGARTDLMLTSDGFGHWFQHGVPVMELTGCLDILLWCSPQLHSLTMRRLGLDFGQQTALIMAYVANPGLALTTVHCRYRHESASALGHTYFCEEVDSGATTRYLVDDLCLIYKDSHDDAGYQRC